MYIKYLCMSPKVAMASKTNFAITDVFMDTFSVSFSNLNTDLGANSAQNKSILGQFHQKFIMDNIS